MYVFMGWVGFVGKDGGMWLDIKRNNGLSISVSILEVSYPFLHVCFLKRM
jgi:hypothetical protein